MPSEVRDEADARGDRRIVPVVLLTLVLGIIEASPTVWVSNGRQADKALIEEPFVRAVFIVVRRADHAGSHIAQRIAASFPVEFLAVVVKDDCLVKTDRGWLAIQDRDRFDERHLAGLVDLLLSQMIAHSQGFDHPGAGKDSFGRKHRSVFELHCGDLLVLDVELRHSAAEFELTSEFTEAPDEILQYQSHPFVRPGKAFQKDTSEHDAELPPVHIVLLGIAVPHQRAEDHFDQERFGKDLFEDFSRRAIKVLLLEFIVVGQRREELGEGILLVRELLGNLALKILDVVVKAQLDAWKGDARTALLGELKVVPSETELFEQPGQGAFLGSFLGEVGHRMQTDIVVPAIDPIERV